MMICCDIGGTFVRFGVFDSEENLSALARVEKYEASRFESLQDALAHYCAQHKMDVGGDLRVATAGYEDSGTWRFVNQNQWVIDPAALNAAGWNVHCILNDFEAASWALKDLNAEDVRVLKTGEESKQGTGKCLIGAGTGLGLGYLHDGIYVQKTHGGHMPVAVITDEQWDCVQQLRALQKTSVVFEDVISGPGLKHLRSIYNEDKALALFHEFLGLFSASVVVSGNAYDGLYFTGGVVQHLMDEGLFDFVVFERWFCLDVAASVQRDLAATPVYYILDPYPALRGLLHA